MNKRFLCKYILVSFMSSVITSVQALPITMDFDLPDWEVYSSPTYGQNAAMSVILDNGTSGIFNQTFLNSEILEISVTSGTYSNTWSSADRTSNSASSLLLSFFSINEFGVAILDLTGPGDARLAFENSNGYWQLGIRDGGGPTTTWLENAPNFSGVEAWHSYDEGFLVEGRVISSIPEPISITLLGLGFLGLALSRKKRPT